MKERNLRSLIALLAIFSLQGCVNQPVSAATAAPVETKQTTEMLVKHPVKGMTAPAVTVIALPLPDYVNELAALQQKADALEADADRVDQQNRPGAAALRRAADNVRQAMKDYCQSLSSEEAQLQQRYGGTPVRRPLNGRTVASR